MATSGKPAPALPYPDFEGLTRQEKVDEMVGYLMAVSASRGMVTLPEPIEFIHKNVITNTVE